jgi:DNA-directed RNA polymerase specialized sigma24 family protein
MMPNTVDPDALDAWIRAALKFMRVRPEELDDAAQDTWISLLASGKLAGARHPKAYVEHAARNSRIDKIKYNQSQKRDRAKTIYLEAYQRCPEAAEKPHQLHSKIVDIEQKLINRVPVIEAIEDAYRSLDSRRWQVIRMRAHGYTQSETTEATDLSPKVQTSILKSL